MADHVSKAELFTPSIETATETETETETETTDHGGEAEQGARHGRQGREADLISPNYMAHCMGGGVECQGRVVPVFSTLFRASLYRLSLPLPNPNPNAIHSSLQGVKRMGSSGFGQSLCGSPGTSGGPARRGRATIN